MISGWSPKPSESPKLARGSTRVLSLPRSRKSAGHLKLSFRNETRGTLSKRLESVFSSPGDYPPSAREDPLPKSLQIPQREDQARGESWSCELPSASRSGEQIIVEARWKTAGRDIAQQEEAWKKGSLGCCCNGFPLSVYDLFPYTRLPSLPRYSFLAPPSQALSKPLAQGYVPWPQSCPRLCLCTGTHTYVHNAGVVRADVAEGWAGVCLWMHYADCWSRPLRRTQRTRAGLKRAGLKRGQGRRRPWNGRREEKEKKDLPSLFGKWTNDDALPPSPPRARILILSVSTLRERGFSARACLRF